MRKPKPTQYDKFKEAAKKAACDESEAAFFATLKKIAKPKDRR